MEWGGGQGWLRRVKRVRMVKRVKGVRMIGQWGKGAMRVKVSDAVEELR